MKTKIEVARRMSVVGVVLLFAGLWGGSWLCHVFPQTSTFGFAAFMTTFLAIVCGFGFVLAGVANAVDAARDDESRGS